MGCGGMGEVGWFGGPWDSSDSPSPLVLGIEGRACQKCVKKCNIE